MDEVRDSVAVSVPFAAGVAAAAFFGISGFSTVTASSSMGLCAILILYLAYPDARYPKILSSLLMVSLGILCYSTSIVTGAPSLPFQGILQESLCWLKGSISDLPFPHESTAPLLEALLTGDRSSLSPATTAAFRGSGASHILALSGLHLGMIYLIVSKVLSLLGNSRKAVAAGSLATIAVTGAYTLMTGAGPSITRAMLFILVNEVSKQQTSRKKKPSDAFWTALFIQLAIQPQVISTMGFQLSYLAVAGITFIFPKLDSWYPEGGLHKIWSAAALAISCQLTTAPLVWLRFHTFPKYFLLTNLLAMPLTEGLMACAVASVVLSGLGWTPLSLIRATDFLAEALQRLLETISSM